MVENSKMMKIWEDKKYFIFSHFCLIESEKVKG